MKTHWIAFLAAVGPQLALAAPIEECGTYNMEGHVVRREEAWMLLLERGSFSEVRVKLTGTPERLKSLVPGANMRMRVTIATKCLYDCSGTLDDQASFLQPYERPAPFLFPRPKPLRSLQCE